MHMEFSNLPPFAAYIKKLAAGRDKGGPRPKQGVQQAVDDPCRFDPVSLARRFESVSLACTPTLSRSVSIMMCAKMMCV